jgi:ribosomal protein L18E
MLNLKMGHERGRINVDKICKSENEEECLVIGGKILQQSVSNHGMHPRKTLQLTRPIWD